VTRVIELVVVAAVAAGLWVLTLSAFPKDDLSLAVGCGLLVAVAALPSRRAVRGQWRPDVRWVRWLGPAVGGAVVDTVAVFIAAARKVSGRPVRSGRVKWRLPPDRRAASRDARAALGVTAISAAPSRVVVDVDTRERVVLVHQLGNGQDAIHRSVAP